MNSLRSFVRGFASGGAGCPVRVVGRAAEGGAVQPRPLLFLGGPFALPLSRLQAWFAAKGYESTAAYPTLSAPPQPSPDFGYELAEAVRGTARSAFPPVIVATGYGCNIASRYLESHPASAAVLISPSFASVSLPKLLRAVRESHPDAFAMAQKSDNLLDLHAHLFPSIPSEAPPGSQLPLSAFVDPPEHIRDVRSAYRIEPQPQSRMPMLVAEFSAADPQARRASDEDVAAGRLECDYLELEKGDGGPGWVCDEEVVQHACEAIHEWLDTNGF
ncbi:hypothetical protein DFJ74DRAFT_757202 [Hyaloraphidium curvatum]|nr:hypothetical protein DFJ74DRAFT_757202 [Hyaloraphidium curvatum]